MLCPVRSCLLSPAPVYTGARHTVGAQSDLCCWHGLHSPAAQSGRASQSRAPCPSSGSQAQAHTLTVGRSPWRRGALGAPVRLGAPGHLGARACVSDGNAARLTSEPVILSFSWPRSQSKEEWAKLVFAMLFVGPCVGKSVSACGRRTNDRWAAVCSAVWTQPSNCSFYPAEPGSLGAARLCQRPQSALARGRVPWGWCA